MLQSSTTTIDKQLVHYLVAGGTNDHTILILHGRGGSSDSRKTVGTGLADLGYSVLIPDLPGFGQTPLTHAFPINNYAQRVSDFMTTINPQTTRITILGHSNGGRIASYGIGKEILQADNLILVNSAGVNLAHDPSPWRRSKRKISKIVANSMKLAKNIPGYRQLRKFFYTISGGQDYLKASDDAMMKQTFIHCFEHSCESEMKQIAIKTLIVRGENDSYTPLWQGEKIHQLIRTSQFILYKGRKHGIHHTDPDRLTADIHSFLVH